MRLSEQEIETNRELESKMDFPMLPREWDNIVEEVASAISGDDGYYEPGARDEGYYEQKTLEAKKEYIDRVQYNYRCEKEKRLTEDQVNRIIDFLDDNISELDDLDPRHSIERERLKDCVGQELCDDINHCDGLWDSIAEYYLTEDELDIFHDVEPLSLLDEAIGEICDKAVEYFLASNYKHPKEINATKFLDDEFGIRAKPHGWRWKFKEERKLDAKLDKIEEELNELDDFLEGDRKRISYLNKRKEKIESRLNEIYDEARG